MSEERKAPDNLAPEIWESTPNEVKEFIFTLLGHMQTLTLKVEELSNEVARLKAQLNQNSQNSSRPPSSDSPFKAKKKARPRGGFRGGQAGHKGQHRALIDVNLVNEVIIVRPRSCRQCKAPLSEKLPLMAPAVRHQVQEIPPVKPLVTEYQLNIIECPSCHETTRATLPSGVPESGYGARAMAIVANLHGQLHLSMRQTEQAMEDLFALDISTGSVSAICQQVSESLTDAYTEVAERIKDEPVLNMDETTWLEQNKRTYLWTAVAPGEALYRIEPTRKKEVIPLMIGENFAGIVGSDRYGGYNEIPTDRRQICWAHVMRNLQGAVDRGGPAQEWASVALELAREVFDLWHEYKADHALFARELEPLKNRFSEHLKLDEKLPRGPTRGLARNLRKLEMGLWTFARASFVEPTNNAAEQALRTAVIWRKTSHGTQSEQGSRFVERMLTVGTTCRKQGKHLLSFLTQAITARWAGLPSPSLFNA